MKMHFIPLTNALKTWLSDNCKQDRELKHLVVTLTNKYNDAVAT